MSHLNMPLWHNRNFLILFSAQTLSSFGDAIFRIALTWLVIAKDGSAAILGGVFLSSVLPAIIFALLGGTLADKANRQGILLAVNSLRAGLMLLFAYLIFNDGIAFHHLYLLSIALGAAGAFAEPAFNALLPSMVTKADLQRANALFSTGDTVAHITGPLIAGGLIAWLGLSGTVFINSLTFVAFVLALMLLDIPSHVHENPAEGTSMLQMAARGFHYIFQRRVLLILMLLFAFVNIAAVIFAVGLPFYISDVLQAGAGSYGIFLAFMNGAILLATLLLTRLKVQAIGCVLLGSFIIQGLLGYLLLGSSTAVVLAIVAVMVIEAASGVNNVLFMAWLQSDVEQAVLGRVYSAVTIVSYALVPLGYALAGFLPQVLGIRLTFMVCGLGLALLGCVAFCYASLRQLRVVQ